MAPTKLNLSERKMEVRKIKKRIVHGGEKADMMSFILEMVIVAVKRLVLRD